MDSSSPFGGRNLDQWLGRKLVIVPAPDLRVDKWKSWLGQIDREVTDLFLSRHIWRSLQQVIGDHPAMPSSVYFEWQAQCYAAAQAVAVRRQREVKDGVITLGRLMTEMAETPELLTRQRYVSMYDWGMQHLGDRHFDRWAPSGGAHLDGAVVGDDLVSLLKRAENIKRYVDKRLAHYEKPRPAGKVPSFADLDDAVEALGEMYRKYAGLLTGGDRIEMTPAIQYDWMAPFRMPWIPQP